MTKKSALTKHRCAICNVRLREGHYTYSRFTQNRYCLDVEKHRRIVDRKRRTR